MTNLTEKHCEACETGKPALRIDEAKKLLAQINHEWQVDETFKKIHRTFKFKNYYQTIAFINAIAWISHQEGHHPDLNVGYNKCVVNYTTHAIGGLDDNDFICAAKIDQLISS